VKKVVVTVAALSLASALVACSGGSPSSTPSAPLTSASSTPSPPPTNALSGRPGQNGPVLAVKLDNTDNSHPHAGLSMADVVYLEEVEWGLTRYVAVFSSKIPKTIGPIRSARIADLELLPQYGKVAFAFSGQNPRLGPLIAAAPLYNVSAEVSGAGYWRQPGRPAPYDLFAHGAALLKRAPHAVHAHSTGSVFAADRPAGGTPVRTFTAKWPDATAQFTWSRSQQRWLLTMDGDREHALEGPRLGGTTVIVQYCKVYDSGYGDKFGGVTPMTDTVGNGKAVVFRDGRMYRVTWQRHSKDSGTHWLYRGHDLALAPGQIWILLENKDRPITTG
jgi:hypothetical protein